MGEGCSETMSSYFQCVSWIELLKTIYLSFETGPNGVHGFIEASVDVAVTRRPDVVRSLCSVKVCDPVVDRFRSLVSNID